MLLNEQLEEKRIRIFRGKFNIDEFFMVLVIFSMILSSGANPLIRSIYFFAACCGIYAVYKGRAEKKYILIAILLIVYVWIDSCILNTAQTDYKECVILTVRIACCCIAASHISLKDFRRIFINIIAVLAVLSLVFFSLYLIFGFLPGIRCVDGWIGTFYHSIGYGNSLAALPEIRNRNRGIFTEPGVFQMYLNFALLAVASDREMPLKKARILFYLFTVTVISTMSSMGYLLYGCVVLVIYIENRKILPLPYNVSKWSRVAILVLFVLCIGVVELYIGKISSFVVGTNSYASRHDDTLLTFLIAKDYPIFGLGLATDMLPVWDRYYYRYSDLRIYTEYQRAMSCGLGNYMALGGIPFAMAYLCAIVKSYFRLYDYKNWFAKSLVAFILLMFLLEEPFLPTPFYLIAFFYCFGRAYKYSYIIRERFKECGESLCPRNQTES